MPVSSPRTPRNPWLLPAVAASLVLGYALVLAFLSPTGFPPATAYGGHMPYLADRPLGEDAFYLFTVADHIATEGHILYNGGVQATGIQPLDTFVLAGFSWVLHREHASEWALLRAALLFGATLLPVFGWQVARIASRLASEHAQTVFTLCFLLVVTDYTAFRLFTYGLETGLYLCLAALCFSVLLSIHMAGHATWRETALLGVLAGFAGLARIDFGVVFALLLLLFALRRLLTPMQVAVSGVIALAIVSPWLLFLYRATGSPMPSSGRAETLPINTATAWPRIEQMLSAIAAHLAPWAYGGGSSWTPLLRLLGVLPLLLLACTKQGRAAAADVGRALRSVRFLLLPLLVLAIVYTTFFFPVWFYARYLAPLLLVTMPLLAIFLAGFEPVRRHLRAAAAVMLAIFAFWTAGSLHNGKSASLQLIAAGYIHTHYPTGRVGAFQSGVAGYFNPNVENLDGKLNLAADRAQQQGTLPAFLDGQHLTALVDWPFELKLYLPGTYLSTHWVPCPVPIRDTGSICLAPRDPGAATR